jgi:peptidoglycan-associated lipoprotein
MRSKLFYVFTAAGLTIFLAGACTSKPTKTDEVAATVGGENVQAATTPTVTDRPNELDPQGSDGGKIAGLNTVYFEYDQSRLTSDSRKKLADNAEWIKIHPSFTIQVEGHTDSRGSVEYNLALGERRAKSVKAYLQTLGVDGKRVTIISYGKEKPIDSGDGEAVWGKNRRANFVPLQ